ncbi:MAG: ATP-binding cassette domain-containing protein [Chloroflexi bacterium]|nr:ATP-binding cassette domain-containing protein [Chloroflexota bacterium]
MTATASDEVVLRCEDIAVAYGDVQALHPTSLSFHKARIHVLVGQNGAGKTSLARVLAGIIQPQGGRFWIRGTAVRDATVQLVRELGLDIVHQRFTLPPNFTVAEALELVSARKYAGAFYSGRQLAASWLRELQLADISASPNSRIHSLPIELIQSLEILRALAGQAQFLILDEPTALLSPSGVDRLFTRLKQLSDAGVTLMLILHKLREVMEIADTISVLRAGRLVLPPTASADLSEQALSDLIIGERAAVESASDVAASNASTVERAVNLSLGDVSTPHSETEPALAAVSLSVKAGEILGIAGVEGNGQRSLVDVLTGLMPAKSGTMRLLGRDVAKLKHHQRRSIGLRVVPFDRVAEGASLGLPLWENVTVWKAEKYRRSRFAPLRIGAMRAAARKALDQFDVQYDSLDQLAGSLSGGNMQRLILARELADNPRVIIAAQPTRGLDFRATQYVWGVLRRLKRAGASIILVSSDLDELFSLSDRISVIRGGRLVAEFAPPFEMQAIGDSMIGATR